MQQRGKARERNTANDNTANDNTASADFENGIAPARSTPTPHR